MDGSLLVAGNSIQELYGLSLLVSSDGLSDVCLLFLDRDHHLCFVAYLS